MQARITRAMVLAAGYGLRLRPLTDHTPKALAPVAGRPMIEYAFDRLRAAGVREVVVNVSHLKEKLKAYLSTCNGMVIRLSEEAEPLETGGGLKQALPLLGDEAFYTVNSDILWLDDQETALDRLARRWNDATMDILLLAQTRARTVGYDKGEDHLFVRADNTFDWKETEAPYIMAGVGIMHPRILRDAPAGKFSVKLLWQRALAQGRLFCVPHQGAWFQTGTEPDIRKTEAILAAQPQSTQGVSP